MEALNFNCVLLIDDDGITNFTNHRLIKKMNITTSIQSATNGSEALIYLKDFTLKHKNYGPELILLDINMPVFDGFEFLDHFERMDFRNKEKIRLIILTTSTHEKDLTKLSKSIQIGYINKPLTQEKLMQAINNQAASMSGL